MAKQIVIIYPDEFEGTKNFTIEFINAHEETYDIEEAETLEEALKLIGNSGEYYVAGETEKEEKYDKYNSDFTPEDMKNAFGDGETETEKDDGYDLFIDEDMKDAFGDILDDVFNPKNPNQLEMFESEPE
jgi:hypothetical protein